MEELNQSTELSAQSYLLAASNSGRVYQTVNSEKSAHFWVCTYPMFESTLYLRAKNIEETETFSATLSFYDADGERFNEVIINVPCDELLAVKLSPFMAESKIQSGFKHARMEVTSDIELLATLRLYASETQQVLEPIRFIHKAKADFFPTTFSVDRLAYLGLVNTGREEVIVRLKLFTQIQGLEERLVLPAQGARVYEVASLFPAVLNLREEKAFPAYIRLMTRSEEPVGLNLYEQRLLKPMM